MPVHLQARLGKLQQRLAVGDRDVADREDPVLPGDPQVGACADVAAACLRQAQQRIASGAATPAAHT